MTPLKEIGEMRFSEAKEGGKDYFFKPSFAAMLAIGEPSEIVSIFSLIHGSEIQPLLNKVAQIPIMLSQKMMDDFFRLPSEEILTTAMRVLHCCYIGEDDLAPLIGEWKGWKKCVVYRPGALPKDDIIILAQQLMQHGVIGKAKVRRLQRHESNEYSKEFKAIDYIIAACNHFGINREEASGMTMTEFALRLAAKYPNEKGFTREEYDATADAFLAKQEKRRAKAKQKQL